jgi:hypothetical protein
MSSKGFWSQMDEVLAAHGEWSPEFARVQGTRAAAE